MQESDERISVIVPVYNVRDYLRPCLDSILRQTRRALEILLIDDGSTDGCGAICDAYARQDGRVRVFHTENRGLAAARNLGLDHAVGEFLAFVDSDDWIEDNALETLMAAQREYGADLVAAGVCDEWVNGSKPEKAAGPARAVQGTELLSLYASGVFRDVMWNKLYRRALFADLRFPEGRNYEDVFVTYRIMQRLALDGGTAVRIPAPLFHFRMRQSSISHTRSLKNNLDAWEAYLEKYREMGEYRGPVLNTCISMICRMWAAYPGYSRDEKVRARETVRAMAAFARAHFREAMTGTRSKRAKLAALLALSANPLSFGLAHAVEAIRKRRRREMFP